VGMKNSPGSRWGLFLVVMGVTVAYAASDEYHQSFVPGRHPGLSDVLIDGLGAATALILMVRMNGFFRLLNHDS
jgi:VanZ family protein